MEEEDKVQKRTIPNGDVSTQTVTLMRPHACLYLPRHSLPEMRSLQLDATPGRRFGTTRNNLHTGSEVFQLLLVSIVVREPSVSGRL